MLSRDLVSCFVGRVELFRNQPGDIFLESADLVISVGFSPVEYDPEVWNAERRLQIVHIDATRMAVSHKYQPGLELTGDLAATLDAVSVALPQRNEVSNVELIDRLHRKLDAGVEQSLERPQSPIHPLRFIHDLQQVVDDN